MAPPRPWQSRVSRLRTHSDARAAHMCLHILPRARISYASGRRGCQYVRVTLVISVHNRDTIWMVTDRRLSYSGRPPCDDAVKVMTLGTTDGVAILGYAGLGATSKRVQPSEWMSAVLRGRGGLTLEQALGVLAAAAQRELPKHLRGMPGGAHYIIVPAFVRGDAGARVYSIDNVIDAKTGTHFYRYTRHVAPHPGSLAPRIVLGGSGGIYLRTKRDKAWQRELLRLLKAHDNGRISDLLIADHLAKLNAEAHQNVADESVGPRCIVVWRRRRDALRERSGGGHQFYTGITRERNKYPIPTIATGIDMLALGNVLIKQLRGADGLKNFATDLDEMSRLAAELPSDPDEKLR